MKKEDLKIVNMKSNFLHSTFFTKCDSCDFITKDPTKLKRHKKCYIFTCKICDLKTSSRKRLLMHTKDMHAKEETVPSSSKYIKMAPGFRCNKCDYTAKSRKLLSIHQKGNCFKYKCSFCEFKTSGKSKYLDHKQKVHFKLIETQFSFQCDECNKTFERNEYLTRHQQKEHNGEVFRCNQCDYLSVVQINLKVHIKHAHNTGLSERARDTQVYPCNLCLLKFVGKTAYRTHLFSHKIEEKGEFFMCTDCSHITGKKEDLIKHLESIHFKLEYKCNHCQVTFGRLDSFRVHLVSKHEENKNDLHRCDRCHYSTRRKDAMLRHMKQTHERVRLHCEFCDYSSVDIRSLKGHVEKIHPNKLKIFLEKFSKAPKSKSDRIYL